MSGATPPDLLCHSECEVDGSNERSRVFDLLIVDGDCGDAFLRKEKIVTGLI